MNMVNNVFDFIRNIFTWADGNNRKRPAIEALSYETNIVGKSKRFRSNETIYSQKTFIDFEHDENDENGDIEILSEYHSNSLRSSSQMNNSRGNRRRSFPTAKATSYRTPQAKSSYNYTSNNSDMGCHSGKGQTLQNLPAVCRNSTLDRTQRLQEKRQYGELLQNFVPRRVHVLHNEPEKNHVSPIEVIELDKSDESQSSQKSIPVPKRQLYTPWKKEKERIFSVNRMRTSSQSTISRIQVEREELSVKPLEKSKDPGSSMPLKVLPTNTLREALASKSVLKKDLVPLIAKRHEDRLKQQLREAEEVRRRANLLSDTNRLTRELSLEEQLARTLKLCEAVIDDREEPEDEPLPTLTEEMLLEVKNALSQKSSNDVLAEGFGLRITRKDIQTLAGLNWLNDEVINFYMNLLIIRGTDDQFPKVHAMNTFFYPKLMSGGHASLKRWTRKIDIFDKDIVVVPVHLGIHWCMSIIDFRDKTIKYFDSMGSANPKCLVALRKYLEDESLDKKKKPYDTSDWKLESVKDIPQQMNGSDCGVFSCMFAEFICAKKRITFTQQDMPYFRNKMVYEILKARLL